jgi:hypothetical protein
MSFTDELKFIPLKLINDILQSNYFASKWSESSLETSTFESFNGVSFTLTVIFLREDGYITTINSYCKNHVIIVRPMLRSHVLTKIITFNAFE